MGRKLFVGAAIRFWDDSGFGMSYVPCSAAVKGVKGSSVLFIRGLLVVAGGAFIVHLVCSVCSGTARFLTKKGPAHQV